MTTIEERLAELEKEVKELKRARSRNGYLAVAGGVAAAMVSIAACKPAGSPAATPSPSSSSSRELHIAAADGSAETVITPGTITIRSGGQDRLRLQVGPDTSALLMRDSSGTGRVALQATDGPVGLSFLDKNGKDLSVLAGGESDASARLELFGADHVLAQVGLDGKGILTIGDPAKPRFTAH